MRANFTLSLAGDVMLGRGVDQILAHPGDPRLREGVIRDARRYVDLAERANGAMPRAVDDAYVWGDARGALRNGPQLSIVNLQTSITASGDFAARRSNYRMNPKNVGCLLAADVDCCVLANDHVLDFGRAGLVETLETLDAAGIRHAGAGRNAEEAASPAILRRVGGRVLVFAFGLATSGIPETWSAGRSRPGVNLIDHTSSAAVSNIEHRVKAVREEGDFLVASIHWGPNWGYAITAEQRKFARDLIDMGFAVVHGHSSHHPLAIEVYRDRLILYGCGNFISDCEGIAGHEEYRSDLAMLYLPQLANPSGRLLGLTMLAFQRRRFRLEHAAPPDVVWLRDVLDRECRRFLTRVEAVGGNVLSLAT